MELNQRLKELRQNIDKIDLELKSLLEERVRVCIEVAYVKDQLNLPITNSNREDMVLKRSRPFEQVFKEIISICKRAEREVPKND